MTVVIGKILPETRRTDEVAVAIIPTQRCFQTPTHFVVQRHVGPIVKHLTVVAQHVNFGVAGARYELTLESCITKIGRETKRPRIRHVVAVDVHAIIFQIGVGVVVGYVGDARGNTAPAGIGSKKRRPRTG